MFVAKGKRTFIVEITLLQYKATKPLYIIDFGDGSPIAEPQEIKKKVFIKHVYEKSGLYTIKVTGYNQVSTKSITKKIELLSPFEQFTCSPYWRLFPIDGTLENAYKSENNIYVVKKEYDVRFFCTWSSEGKHFIYII